jgi:ribosomal protein S18 acetylase RimI-like enzyme
MIIRSARNSDVEAIHHLIIQLAEYEKAPEKVVSTPEVLSAALFQSNPWVFAWVAESASQEIVGAAICYLRYSTWNGPVLYLEDLIVDQNFRRINIGTLLMQEIIGFAKLNSYRHITWQVLDWNLLAIDFYKKFDVDLDPSWVNVILPIEK